MIYELLHRLCKQLDVPTKEDPKVTVLHIYDGQYFLKEGRMDKVTIVVEGTMLPEHVASIQSTLVTKYRNRYQIKRYIPDREAITLIQGFGYRIVGKSVVYNVDYTGTDVRDE